MSYSVIRSHEICAGHRVVGHESKCRHLHGHNYVFHFKVQPRQPQTLEEIAYDLGNKLDNLGRVIDFSVVKSTLCQWLEDNWDHKFLHWEKDPLLTGMEELVRTNRKQCMGLVQTEDSVDFFSSLVRLPFNPTAENLAAHMVNVIGPMLLDEHGVELVSCTIEETSKCHVEYIK